MDRVLLNSFGGNLKSAVRNFKFAILLGALLFAPSSHLGAQQPAKVPRIGYLNGSSFAATSERVEAFRQGLRELGYVEGKNIVIEWRSADGNRDRQRALAVEFARLKVDVIVGGSGGDTSAAREATATIPIVMAQSDDPIASGFVVSLARPGGNVTGLSTLSPELSGKRVELLKEVIPKLSRVAVFGTSTSVGNAQVFREVELAAAAFGVKLQYIDVLSTKDIAPAFRVAAVGRADAVFEIISGRIRSDRREQIAQLAVKSRLPLMFERPDHVDAGGLISYGISLPDLDRRAAWYVDRILKGAKPAELPVEQPTKFELVINLKTAKQIGVTIPPNVLARADKVIR